MIFKPGIKIRVGMGRAPSGAEDGFVSSPPITLVTVACADNDQRSVGLCEALIDTGADYVAIDFGVADAIGATLKGNGVVGRGAFGMQSGLKHTHIKILLPGIIFEVPMAAVTDLRRQGNSFDVLLGRCFLKNCRLTVDGPNQAYDLEWVDIRQTTQPSLDQST